MRRICGSATSYTLRESSGGLPATGAKVGVGVVLIVAMLIGVSRDVAAPPGGSPSTVDVAAVATRPAGEPAAVAAGCSGAEGDVDGDGVRDTVIADPRATVDGQVEAGVVHVISGGDGAVHTLRQGLAGVPDTAEAGDRFGHALAIYDADQDGCADLAVGTPYEDADAVPDAGGVWILPGSPAGVGAGPTAVTLRQGAGGLGDTPEAGDWFGFALAGGRTAAGAPYLVVGAPGEDLGTVADAGAVHYLRGPVAVTVTQDSSDVPGEAEIDDRFGAAVAGSPGHLAIGAPGETTGSAPWSGEVDVFVHPAQAGPPPFATQVHQDLTGVSDVNEADDQFGKAVALAAYRPAGTAQIDSILVIGVPGEDNTVDGVARPDAGRVQRFHLAGTTRTELSPLTFESEDGDGFGERLVLVNTDPATETTPSTMFLAVGTPGEDRTSTVDAGVVRVFAGPTDPGSYFTSVERMTARLPGQPVPDELLGLAIGGNAMYLFVASPYRGGVVYALPWSSMGTGSVTPAHVWQPGQGGLPAGGVSFGEVTA